MKIKEATKKLWIFGRVEYDVNISDTKSIMKYLILDYKFDSSTKGHFLNAYWKVRDTIIERIKSLYRHKPFFYYGELVAMPHRAHGRIRDLT